MLVAEQRCLCRPAGVRAVGKLTLCDLAGSERITKTGATGARQAALTSHEVSPRVQFLMRTVNVLHAAGARA